MREPSPDGPSADEARFSSPHAGGESFFRAQARHRRVALVLTVMTFVGLALMSAPIASLLFPALFAVLGAISNILSPFLPTPDLGAAMAAYWDHLFEPRNWRDVVASAFLLLSPGFLAMALLYRRARRLLRREGGAAFRDYLGARGPNASDAEERQLANLVEEMSIAAGRPAPALYLTEGRGVNAGAFALGGGVKPFVVVAREMLDTFERAETAGLAGHVVALGVMGDDATSMRIASTMIAIDISGALLAAPFDAASRHRAARFLFDPHGLPIDEALDAPSIDKTTPPEKGWRVYAALPFMLAHATFHLVRLLAGLLFFSPALGFLLRRRRFLADATAIELTRQPDALARALAHLSEPGQDARAAADLPGNFVLAARKDGAHAEATASLVKPHPPVAERIERLRRMGAATQDIAAPKPRAPLIVMIFYGVVGALAAALVPLMIFVMAALTLLSFGLGMLAAFAVVSLTGFLRP
jgi:Zn-dependent protease with chaperone function